MSDPAQQHAADSLPVEKQSTGESTYDISIVTPSLNQAPYLEQTLRSVLDQTDVSLQYIVVDGNSSDGSRDILARYRDRIDVLIIEPDKGQADAIRKGFQYATGHICCYLNSDDYLLPGALRRVVDYFNAHESVDVVYGHRIYVDGNNRFLKYWILPPHINYFMKRWDYIPQECTFWRRSAMETVGGIDAHWQFAVDYDFFVRLMEQGRRFRRHHGFLGVFRQHDMSKTTRLMDTLGLQEVVAIREKYRIAMHPWDGLIAAAFHGCIMLPSRLYKFLAGSPRALTKTPDSGSNRDC